MIRFRTPAYGNYIPPMQNLPVRLAAGIGWRMQLLIFFIAAAAVVSRRPDAIFNPQFFGEDGAVWYREAYQFGWLTSLLYSRSGYFQTVPRLAASLSLLVPLHFAPLIMNLIGITFQILPVNVLLSARLSNWAPVLVRAFMAVAYIALPNSMELNATVEEAQWHLALLVCLLVLASPPKRHVWRIADIVLILLSGLSGPFCLMLLPVALIFGWIRREPWRIFVISALTLPAFIQLSAIVTTASATRRQAPLGATPQLFVRLLAGQIYLGALFGQTSSPTHKGHLALALAGILGTAFVIYCAVYANLERKLFLLFCALVFAASLKSPMASMTTPQWQVLSDSPGIRYWFLPMIGFVWALIWCAASATAKPVRVAAACALASMLIGIVKDWEYPAYTDFHFKEYAARFAAAAPGTLVNIPIYPPPWVMPLVKRSPLCHTLPLGNVDQPAPNAQISGPTAIGGWAVALEPIQRILIYVDRSLKQSTQLNVMRPDVDLLYPHWPDKRKGWSAFVDMSRLAPGKHEIEVRALQGSGCEADFAVIPITSVASR